MAGASQAVPRALRESPESRERSREGGHATVRELLPWHATGEGAVAFPSGILLAEAPASDVSPVAARADERESASASSEPLSFQVYSLADLDARRPDGGPALRMSRLMFELAPKPKSPWALTGERGYELVSEVSAFGVSWARTKQRPSVDPVRARWTIFRAALDGALRAVDWRRAYAFGGASLATVVTLLAIVLTVADLTDDLKPARAPREVAAQVKRAVPDATASAVSTAARAELAGTGIAAPSAPAPKAAEEAPPAPAAAPIELDEAPAPVARSWQAAPRPRVTNTANPRPAVALSGSPLPGGPLSPRARAPTTAPAKGAAKSKLSFRDADEVFRP